MEYGLTTEGDVSSRPEPQKGDCRRWGQGVRLESSMAVILYKAQLCPSLRPPHSHPRPKPHANSTQMAD